MPIPHRFGRLASADVEDLLAERGVSSAVKLFVSGSIALAVIFRLHSKGPAEAKRQVAPRSSRHTIGGKKFWLWRAIGADGNVLDILVQTRRNTKSAKRVIQAGRTIR